jgi:hypothetical protein
MLRTPVLQEKIALETPEVKRSEDVLPAGPNQFAAH